MKGSQLRLLVALANLGLMIAIAVLAVRIVKGAPFPPNETPNPNFNAPNYQIQELRGPRSSIQEYQLIWNMFDRPLPPPTRVVAPPPPQQPARVATLADRLRVVAVHDAKDPQKSTAIVEPRGGGPQQMVKISEMLQGFEVVKIRADGESAILTVKAPGGKTEDIRLAK